MMTAEEEQVSFSRPVVVRLHRVSALALISIIRELSQGERPEILAKKFDFKKLESELCCAIDFATSEDESLLSKLHLERQAKSHALLMLDSVIQILRRSF